MNSIRKKLAFLLTAALLLTGFNFSSVTAESYNFKMVSQENKDERETISRWVADEEKGLIYALSTNKKLLVISMEDFKLEKAVAVEGSAYDMELYDGKVYISDYSGNSISIIDTDTLEVKRIRLENKPSIISVMDNKIFYMSGSSLYVYENDESRQIADFPDIKEKWNTTHFKIVNMAADANANRLYLSKVTTFTYYDPRINLHVLDTDTMEFISYKSGFDSPTKVPASDDKIVYYDNYSDSNKSLFAEGGSLYYGQYKMNPASLETYEGAIPENIVFADERYIASKDAVYDNSNLEKLADLPFESENVYIDAEKNIYLYDSNSRSFLKYDSLARMYGASDYEQQLSGDDWVIKNTADLSYSTENAAAENIYDRDSVTDWGLDEENSQIYGLTNAFNKVLLIDKNTLKLKAELLFKYKPSDIELNEGLLYVSFYGYNKAVVINAATMETVRWIKLNSPASQIIVGNSKLVYASGDSPDRVRAVSLDDGSDSVLEMSGIKNDDYIYRELPGMELIKGNDAFYAANLNISSANLNKITLDDYKLLQDSFNGGEGFPYPKTILADDASGDVYIGMYRLDNSNLSVKGRYGTENNDSSGIVMASDSYVFSGTSVYDKEKYVRIGDLPYEINNPMLIDDTIYYFDSEGRTICAVKMDSMIDGLINVNEDYDESDNSGYIQDAYTNYDDKTADPDMKSNRKGLSNWVLDEKNKQIYGLNVDSNAMLVLSAEDFRLQQTIDLTESGDKENTAYLSKDAKIIQQGSKLYIPVENKKQVVEVDTEKMEISGRYQLKHAPVSIAVYGDRLLYYTKDINPDRIFEFSFQDGKETSVNINGFNINMYDLMLYQDEDNASLYIAGDKTLKMDLETGSVTGWSNDDLSGYTGFIIDNGEIFTGPYRYSGADAKILTKYDGMVEYVKGSYVYTDASVYERETGIKAGDIDNQGRNGLAADSDGTVYIYNSYTRAFYKDFPEMKNGGMEYKTDGNTLELSDEITDLVYDQDENMIYAISGEANCLIYINGENMQVVSSRVIGSGPSDIEMHNGKLYIALSGTKELVILDTEPDSRVDRYALNNFPEQIQVTDDGIFYTYPLEYSGYALNYISGLSDNEEKRLIDNARINQYSRLIAGSLGDKVYLIEDSRLYVMDSSDPEEYKNLYPEMEPGKVNYLKTSLQDGENLYAGSFGINKESLQVDYIYDSDVIGIKDDLVYTRHAIFNSDDEKVTDLPFISSFALENDMGNVFLYDESSDRIVKYASVDEISNNQKEAVKLGLTGDGKLKLSWDPVPGISEYALAWSYDGSMENWRNLSTGTVNGTEYIIDYIDSEWLDKKVNIGVTRVKNNEAQGYTPEYIYEIPFYNAVKLTDGIDDSTLDGDNYILDLSAIVDINQYEDDDKTGELKQAVFRVRDLLAVDGLDYYTLKIDENVKRVILELSGKVYKKLKESEHNNYFILDTPTGKYTLPVWQVDLDGFVDNPEDAKIEIIIEQAADSDIADKLRNDGLVLRSKPTSFTVRARTGEYRLSKVKEIKSLGDEYFECWIPLNQEPVQDETFGIYIDRETGAISHVPTIFIKDGDTWYAGLKENGNGIYAVAEYKKTFEDIYNHWAKSDIELMASKLVVRGMSNEDFAPDEAITRAQYTSLLVRALGLVSSGDEIASSCFTDIKEGKWYENEVGIAVEHGLVYGYPDGEFKPDDKITREEMASLIMRALEFVEKDSDTAEDTILNYFKDSGKISGWARNDAALAVKGGLIMGKNEMFDPSSEATRAEGVAVLKRMLDKVEGDSSQFHPLS